MAGERRSSDAEGKKKAANAFSKVKVFVRCRPRSERERGKDSPIQIGKGILSVQAPRHPQKKFSFDHVFGPTSSQADVYKVTVSPIVKEVLQGYNCTVFAYGQTGTGKTYTMEGGSFQSLTRGGPLGGVILESSGVIPRAVQEIFSHLEERKADYTVNVSHLEIYNETLMDLLSNNPDVKLNICHDPQGNTIVSHLEEVLVSNAGEIYKVLARGQEKRTVAETNLNQESSRSHCIFTIKIQIKELNEANGEEVVKVGKLNLVDLAGSENVERSGATKRRAAEAGNINKSLLALARVIKDLASHSGYISYRESKLTRLLQESLGGKAKTCMIATISPSGEYLEDTLSTLDYAHQARNIRNQPQINQTIGKKVMINQLQNELDMYRQKLEDQYEKNGVYIPTEKHQEMLRSLSALQESEALLQKSVLGKSDELESWKKNYHQIAAKLEKTEEELKHTGEELASTQETLSSTRGELAQQQTFVRERDFLLAQHKSYEAVLQKQAKTLSGELEEATAQIAALYEKISRQDRVIQDNKEQFVSLQKDLKETFGSLSDGVDDDQENQDRFGDNIKAAMEGLVADVKADSQKVETGMENILSSLRNTSENFLSSEKLLCENLEEEISKGDRKLAEILNEAEERESNLRSSWLESLAGLENEVTASLKATKEWSSSAECWSQSHMKSINKSVTQQSECLGAVMTQLEALSQESSSNSEAREEMLSSLIQEQQTSSEKFRQDVLASVTQLFENHLTTQKSQLASCLATYQEKEKTQLDVFNSQFFEANNRVESALSSSKSIKEQTEANGSQRASLVTSLVNNQEVFTNFTSNTLDSLRSGYQGVYDGSRERDMSLTQEIKGVSTQLEKMLEDRKAEREGESAEMMRDTEMKVGGVREHMSCLGDAVGRRSESVGGDMIDHLACSNVAADGMKSLLSHGGSSVSSTSESWKENTKTQSTPSPRPPFSMEHATIASDEQMLNSYGSENLSNTSSSSLGDSSLGDSVDFGGDQPLSASCPAPSSSSLQGIGSLSQSSSPSHLPRILEEEAAKRPQANTTPSKTRGSRKRTREPKGAGNENLPANSSLKQPSRALKRPRALNNITNTSRI